MSRLKFLGSSGIAVVCSFFDIAKLALLKQNRYQKKNRPRQFLKTQFFLPVFLGLLSSSSGWAQEKLIFAIDVIRHGDRTPVMTSPEMEKIWPQGPGQLTPEGMRQEYLLGGMLRQRYVMQYHLLPEAFDVKTMHVRSSDLPRTLMSAQSILFGLYPLNTGPKALPEGFQPVPIHTVPQKEDSLLVPDHDKEKYKKLLQTYLLNSPEWIQRDQALRPYYRAWSQIFGVNIQHLFELIRVSDRIFIEQLYHLPLPEGLSEEEAKMILDAGTWAWLDVVNHPKFGTLMGGELAQTIKHEMTSAATQDRPLKYLLFVAHDSTIAAQLNLLGHMIDDIPPYASELHYGLFDVGNSNYEVRVTYNQKPLFIKACHGESCRLDDFLTGVE